LVLIGHIDYSGDVLTIEQSLRSFLDEQAASGALGPGSKLPTERDLVARLAAPRSAIRRALDSLETDGLIVRQVGRGTFLTDRTHAAHDGAPPDTSPAEIMQVRLAIEPPIAALAARVATQADLRRITDCLDHGGASGDFEGFESWDATLHRAIAHAAHNGLLLSMFDVMNTARALPVWGSLKRRTSTPERRRCYHDEHTAIVAALADRDPAQAHEAMRVHLENVADNLLGRH
jgi:DNA-binding FadR family transcriptional regulator